MKKLFTLLMTLWLAIGSLFAVDFQGGEILYLTPGNNWINNAKDNGGGNPGRYAAYFFGNGDKWVAMTAVAGETELYQVTAPAGYKNVIFCAMNPSSSGLSWDDKWNQTEDLTYDGTKNHYTVKNDTWDKGGGTWSLYAPDPVINVGTLSQFPSTTVNETSTATLTYTVDNSDETAKVTVEGEGFTAEDVEGTITITFAPTEAKEYTATLTIAIGDIKETVDLVATGVAADAPKVPEILNLKAGEISAIYVGETTEFEVTYELANAEEATASIEGEGFTIKKQEVGTATIEFAPTEAKTYEAVVTITSGETTQTLEISATATNAPTKITITYVNTEGYENVYVHAWGGTASATAWPGEKLTATGEKINGFDAYSFTFDEGAYVSCLFNCGGANPDACKTGDQTIDAAKTYFYGGLWYATEEEIPAEIADVWTVVGVEGLFETAWDFGNVAYDMTEGEAGIYTLVIDEVALDATDYTYKFVQNRSWSGAQYPKEGNYTLNVAEAASYKVTYTLDTKAGNGTCAIEKVTSPEPDPEPEPEPEPTPEITVSETEVDFGEITVGEQANKEVTYTYKDTEKPEISLVGNGFSYTDNEESIIITFAPVDAGEYEGTLTVGKAELAKTITLKGTAKAAVDPEPEPDPDPTPEYPKTITVKVACAWETCNIWAWYADESGNVYTEWPGEAMTKGEDGFYAIEMSIESPVYFKVNAGLGKTESENYMTELSESTCFNMDGLTLVVNEDCEYEEPVKIEPYYGIRGITGSWEMADDIKLTEDADKAEWYITNIEVDGTQEFKVVYVDETGAATWYGAGAVEANEALGEFGEGDENIKLAAGKYDIYFKVNEGKIWIQKYVAPKPELIVSTEEVVFETLILDGEQFSSTETITYEIINSDEAAVIALESEVFEAEDENGTITITFAPIYNNYLYKAELTITLGDIVKTVAISAVVKPLIDDLIYPGFDDTKVGEYEEIEMLYSLHKGNEGVARIEGDPAFEITSQEVGRMFIKFTPLEVKEYTATLIITSGKFEREITIIANGIAPDPEPTDITFTVQVPEGTKECYIAGTSDDEDLAWKFIQMEKVDGEENLFSITVEKTVLDGKQWKYASGADWQYAEVIEGNGNRTEADDPYDVVTAWQKLYDPDFQPIDPYYAIRGLNGDASWTGSGDIKLEESADASEWVALGFTVAEGESFKVIYIDENAKVSGYYAGLEEGCEVGQTYDDNGNLVLPAGTYNLYFKPNTELMWISKVDTPTDAEEAVAELIYAVDGTIIAPAPFAIIDLAGKDVTKANGSLQGTYIVKTLNSVAKISVK